MFDEYFELQKKIHDYFGYKEDWVVIPLEDHREYYWQLNQVVDKNGEDNGGYVRYYDEPLTQEILDGPGEYYESEIYTQRFLPKWVYRTEEYTLICMDTHTDGNKFLGIFDNSKEMKDD